MTEEYVIYYGLPSDTLRRLVSVIGLTIFLNIFFLHAFGSVAFVLSIVGFLVFLIAVYYRQAIQPNLTIAVSGTVALALSILFAILTTANSFISFFLGLSVLFVLQHFAYLLYHNIPSVRTLSEFFLEPIDFLASYAESSMQVVANFTATRASGVWRQASSAKTLIVGLVVGIPLAIVLVGMLSGADPIFSFFIKNIISIQFLRDAMFRTVFSIVVLGMLAPFLLLVRGRREHEPFRLVHRFFLGNEMIIVMALVALVVGLFLLIQWPYVFASVAAEINLSKFGVATYSEYVKRGFFELLAVSAILYGVLWAGLLAKRRGTQQANIFSVIQAAVFLEFGLFILSIFRRIWLYQHYHGWSLVRIYGGFLLLWIGLMVVTLAGRHVLPKLRWVVFEVAVTAAVILFVGFVHAEYFVAVVNPPTVNGRIDYVYLSRLSADGYKGWKKSYDWAKQTLSNPFLLTKPMLDQHDRKDIAYAGIILQQLTKRYHALIGIYGSPMEKKDYVLNITTHQKNGNKSSLNSLSSDQALIRILPNRIYAMAPSRKLTVTAGSLQQSFYTIFPDVKGSVPLGLLDKLFLWNASEANAYQRIVEEIPFTDFLRLQESFFTLNSKIARQPAREQGFSADISLDAPFLSPL